MKTNMEDNQQTMRSGGSVSSSEYRKECHDLLLSLKTTVEGLLALPCNNVWNTFGGLDRLAKSIESVLIHRLKVNQAGSQEVLWHFVRGLRWLNPASAPFIDRLNRNSRVSKGHQWLRETLESLNLSSQLVILVRNRQHLLQHYHAEAFLCQPDYFFAMQVCLHAVEQNSPALLAEINPAMLYQPTSIRRVSHVRSNSLPFIRLSQEISGLPAQMLKPDSSVTASMLGHRRQRSKDARELRVFDGDVNYGLYDTNSIETLSELNDSDHVMGRINDPLMNFYETSSTEKLKHSQMKLGPSVSSEILNNSYGVSIPETPSNPQPTFSALPAQDLSFSHQEELQGNTENHAAVYPTKDSHNCLESAASKIEMDLQVTQTVRQKLLKRVQERDLKAPDAAQKFSFSDILSDDDSVEEKSCNTEVIPSQKMDHVLDLILNNENLDIQSVQADSGIESQTNRASVKLQKADLPVQRDLSSLRRNRTDGALSASRHLETDSWCAAGRNVEYQIQSDSRSSITGKSDVVLSSSLPSAVHGQTDTTMRQGFFRPPLEGQSLMSFLSSQDFHTCTDLDRESAHFSIAEALIAAVEQMKWNQTIAPRGEMEHEECDSDEEIQMLKQRIRIRRTERLKEKARQFPGCFDPEMEDASRSDSCPSFESLSAEAEYSSSSEDVHDAAINDLDAKDQKINLIAMKENGLSLSMASLYSDADLQRSTMSQQSSMTLAELQTSLREGLSVSGSHQTSADSIAISLLKQFSEKQLPKASELVWLVSERDAPQQLLPLPDSYPISPDDGENADIQAIHQQNRLRGNLYWAPPRPQIISTIHSKLRQSVVVARQNHRCAGCGSKVEKGFVRRYRYCEYLGKYFCQCCHTNERAYIPGRILRKWDFGKYAVSHFAHEFLKSIYEEPVFTIESKTTGLYQKVPTLEEMRDMRVQLHYLVPFIETCKQTDKPSLDAVPSHWFSNLDNVHYYSLSELVKIKKKELVTQLRDIVSECIMHISQCLLCRGKGFICEICRNGSDIIFPFEIGRVMVCTGCRAAFHRTCHESNRGNCPKCIRLLSRKHTKNHDTERTGT